MAEEKHFSRETVDHSTAIWLPMIGFAVTEEHRIMASIGKQTDDGIVKITAFSVLTIEAAMKLNSALQSAIAKARKNRRAARHAS